MTQVTIERTNLTMTDHLTRGFDPYTWGKYKIAIRHLNKYIPNWRNSKMLNVGCGAGDFSHLILKEINSPESLTSAEPDAEAFRMAQENLAEYPDSNLLNVSIENLDVPDNKPEVIFMHDVLEHIEDDKFAVKRLRDLISEDGWLVVSVPQNQWLYGQHDEELLHFRRYSKKSLAAALEPEFEIKTRRNYGFLFMPITLLYSVWLRHPYPKSVSKRDWKYWIARLLVAFEERVPVPNGTSILVFAKPRKH